MKEQHEDGALISLAGTPHLWIADGSQQPGAVRWIGDSRALANLSVRWDDQCATDEAWLQAMPKGDPILSSGLVKIGDPIYLSKWETEAPTPTLLHIRSIADVELFGINAENYGRFVHERADWERAYGFDTDSLPRGVLATAVTHTDSPGYRLGLEPSPIKGRLTTRTATLGLPELPSAAHGLVDLSADFPPIGDQSSQNSCTGWAVGYYVKGYQEAVEHRWDPGTFRFSPSFVYNQCNGGMDKGCYLIDALRVVQQTGNVFWSDFPYREFDYRRQPTPDLVQKAGRFRAAAMARLWGHGEPPRLDLLKDSLARGLPVVLGINVRDNRAYCCGPVFDTPAPSDRFVNAHAVTAVGYDDRRQLIKIANSWGTGWGERGYGYLTYRFAQSPETFEAWVLIDQPDTDRTYVDQRFGALVFNSFNGWNSEFRLLNAGTDVESYAIHVFDEGNPPQLMTVRQGSLGPSENRTVTAAALGLPYAFRGTANVFVTSVRVQTVIANANLERVMSLTYEMTSARATPNCTSAGFLSCLAVIDARNSTDSRGRPIGPTFGARIYNADPTSSALDAEVTIEYVEPTGFVRLSRMNSVAPYGVLSLFAAQEQGLPPFWSGTVRVRSTGNWVGVYATSTDYGSLPNVIQALPVVRE